MLNNSAALNKNKRKHISINERLIVSIFFLLAMTSVITVIFITIFMFISGAPAILKIGVLNFIFGNEWNPTADTPLYGIFPLIISSLCGTLGAVLIGVPIGLLVAVFIAELCPKWASDIIRPAVELLAGIPSVIYGFLGLILLVPFIQKNFNLPSGETLLSAIIVLSIMVLPTIISVSEISIRAVPKTYLEASLALGVTKEYSIFKVIIPAARSGIMTGILLGVGRAIGEAMAVIMVAGNTAKMPELFSGVRFLTTGIVAEMAYADEFHRSALFGIGLVLFIFIFLINSVFKIIIKKAGVKYE